MGAVHISIMSGKLDGFKSISTNTLTNQFCIKMNRANEEIICSHCYSHTMLKGFRKNAAPPLQRNSDLLSSRPLTVDELPFMKENYVRFNAHGELINAQHLENLVAITLHNPHCNFALWSKRKDIIKKFFSINEKPSNLLLIYSNPKIGTIIKEPPIYFDRTFNNVLEDEYVDRQNCTGQKCKHCLLCYTHNKVNTIVEKVKRY